MAQRPAGPRRRSASPLARPGQDAAGAAIASPLEAERGRPGRAGGQGEVAVPAGLPASADRLVQGQLAGRSRDDGQAARAVQRWVGDGAGRQPGRHGYQHGHRQRRAGLVHRPRPASSQGGRRHARRPSRRRRLLPDDCGHMVSLNELLTQRSVAVTFHRGHWCPYCRININALAQAHQEIAAEGGQIVAIMPDLQKFVAEFRSESKVPFPILTDMDNGYALSLNLTIWVGAELQKLMEGRRNLPVFQGNSSWMLPIPATFVVGRDGRIRARFMDPDYRKRMAIADMLAALRSGN